MPRTTYNSESFQKHGISKEDVDDVLATGVWEELLPSDRGNDRLMFVGFIASGRLLEIGVEYIDDENLEHVFHADNATRQYQHFFQKRTVYK